MTTTGQHVIREFAEPDGELAGQWQSLELRLPQLPGRRLTRIQIATPGQPASLDSVTNSNQLRVYLPGNTPTDLQQHPIVLDDSQPIKVQLDKRKYSLSLGLDVIRLFDEKGVQFGSVPIRSESP